MAAVITSKTMRTALRCVVRGTKRVSLQTVPTTSSQFTSMGLRMQCITWRNYNSTLFTEQQITAALVKELRTKTGAPMMDCKKALSAEEVEGDISKAMDWLRKKGMARASSGSDRVTAEGVVAAAVDEETGRVALVEVNSETDFVSLNKEFQLFVAMICETVLHHEITGVADVAELLQLQPHPDASSSAATVQEALGDLTASIRENIIIKRVEILQREKGALVSAYVHGRVGSDHLPPHLQLGKAAAVVELSGHDAAAAASVGKKLAMHVVAAQPAYLKAADVPADVISSETQIFREQTLAAEAEQEQSKSKQKKPKSPEMIERIVQGKVNKRLNEVCLLGQAHMAEEGSPNIEKFLKSQSLSCLGFRRWIVGS